MEYLGGFYWGGGLGFHTLCLCSCPNLMPTILSGELPRFLPLFLSSSLLLKLTVLLSSALLWAIPEVAQQEYWSVLIKFIDWHVFSLYFMPAFSGFQPFVLEPASKTTQFDWRQSSKGRRISRTCKALRRQQGQLEQEDSWFFYWLS